MVTVLNRIAMKSTTRLRANSNIVPLWTLILLVVTSGPFSTFAFRSVQHTRAPQSVALRLARKGNAVFTIKDLREEMERNPAAFQDTRARPQPSKRRRTRRRVENPKQTYVYASQRLDTKNVTQESDSISLARQLGLTNPGGQHCDAGIDQIEPKIVGQIRISDQSSASASHAYIIDKPSGWSIIGSSSSKRPEPRLTKQQQQVPKKTKTKVRILEKDGASDLLEYDENDILEQMTPEEREAYLETERIGPRTVKVEDEEDPLDPLDQELFEDDFDEEELLALLTPEERAELEAELAAEAAMTNAAPPTIPELVSTSGPNHTEKRPKERIEKARDTKTDSTTAQRQLDESTLRNLRRIEARSSSQGNDKASFASPPRPSVVAWFKELKASEGIPIRGGSHWKAVAGASEVDDSGLVLLCPKAFADNVFIDYAQYVAVVGNGNYLSPKPQNFPKESVQLDIVAKLRKNRGDDTIQTVKVTIPEHFSTCSSVVGACQKQFKDGIRGDPGANPLDRRAPRRLIHCQSLSVSSLTHDENAQVETAVLPDDIAILAERRNHHEFKDGSFLGRTALKANPLTTAYREINGAADGYPGWTVDRYDKWLLVQQDPKAPRGPLPSIHDGNTLGVYMLPSNPDRSDMRAVKPLLLEGKEAPTFVSVLENGITYHVALDRDLSTGMFLDQRMQRAWLSKNCNQDTRVLNCFAHSGAFSVAAATAGASTVSLDLNKKWLDRVEPQLKANGVEFDDRHDCIYGDCFEWLTKLSKRNEKYDIVILDPPSSSVGKKKKRWSIKNDMAELVTLAAPLVKKGGLLWTSTNSASIPAAKFARLCNKGLEDAGREGRLERIQPMAVDFPSIGPQAVKNLVWRLF